MASSGLPIYGVAVLMAIALILVTVLVERTPLPATKTSLSAPFRALRHRGLLTLSLMAFAYNWGLFTLLVIAVCTDSRGTLIVAVIAAGAMIGVNNTLVTQAVMTVSTLERPVASSAYSFVRFLGGGLAPFAAGQLGDRSGWPSPSSSARRRWWWPG